MRFDQRAASAGGGSAASKKATGIDREGLYFSAPSGSPSRPSGEELVAFEQKLQISLREQLVRALGRYGIPVTVATTSLLWAGHEETVT